MVVAAFVHHIQPDLRSPEVFDHAAERENNKTGK